MKTNLANVGFAYRLPIFASQCLSCCDVMEGTYILLDEEEKSVIMEC